MNKIVDTITITYNDVELTVIGKYVKGEQVTFYDLDGAGSPLSNSDFEIHSIMANGYNIKNIFYESQLDDIIELTLSEIEE